MVLSATEHNLSWPNLILLENIRFSHRVFSEFIYITGDVYNKKKWQDFNSCHFC